MPTTPQQAGDKRFDAGDGPLLPLKRVRSAHSLGRTLIRDHRGSLREQLHLPLAAGSRGRTPVEWLSELCALSPGWLAVHGVHVTPGDIDRLANAGCVMVHCPRSNANLGVGRMPLERYAKRGVEVMLGTDSRASVSSLSVSDELAACVSTHPNLTTVEITTALTPWRGL